MKNKSIFLITSYYRSLLYIISSIAVITYSTVKLKETINDYPIVKGNIVKAHLTWDESPYSIKLGSDTKNWYCTYIRKYFDLLEEKAIPGKQAKIWYVPKDNRIKQLIVNDEILVPYYKGSWINYLFIGFGIIFLVVNIIYIIQNPSHAKEEDNNINDGN